MRTLSAARVDRILVGGILLVAWAGASPSFTAAAAAAKPEEPGKGAGDHHHELIEVTPARWSEIAGRCQAARAGEEPAPEGHLVKLRLGDDLYEIYVGGQAAIVCGRKSMREDSGAVPAADSQLAQWLEQAKQELAQKLSCSEESVELRRAERVVWRDSSLGCPQKGMMYMQVLTEGVRIVLRAAGADYDFHGGRDAPPFLCEHPSPIEPLPGHEVE